MKKYLLYGVLLSCMFTASAQEALANSLSFYVGGKFGYNTTMLGTTTLQDLTNPNMLTYSSSDSSSAFPIGIATGISIPIATRVAIRTEMEYTFVTPTILTSTIFTPPAEVLGISYSTTMHRLFANMYIDIYATQKMYFYASGGVGVAFINSKLSSTLTNLEKGSRNATQFAWNAGIGAGYNVTEKIFLDLGVRYMDFGSLGGYTVSDGPNPIVNVSKANYSGVDLLLTVAYRF